MLSQKEIVDKVYSLVISFDVHFLNKNWGSAKWCYDTAVTVAVFCDMPQSDREKLFGNRSYKDDADPFVDGLFMEEKVDRVYKECAVKGNQTARSRNAKRLLA